MVLDVHMPGMDGLATLAGLKELAPETEVIMLTGYANLKDGVEARLGAYDYLMKPCDLDDLIDKIMEAHELDRIKAQPVLWSGNRVREVMVDDYDSLPPDQPLTRALELVSRRPEGAARENIYILENDGRIVGFVDPEDLVLEAQKHHPEFEIRWAALRDRPDWLPAKSLAEIMHPEVISTTPEEGLTEAAHSMMVHNQPNIPVLEEDRVVGIVRLKDILEYIQFETQ